jgi:hypothetical protein
MQKVSVMTVCHKVLQTLSSHFTKWFVKWESGDLMAVTLKVFQHVKLRSVVEIIVGITSQKTVSFLLLNA